MACSSISPATCAEGQIPRRGVIEFGILLCWNASTPLPRRSGGGWRWISPRCSWWDAGMRAERCLRLSGIPRSVSLIWPRPFRVRLACRSGGSSVEPGEGPAAPSSAPPRVGLDEQAAIDRFVRHLIVWLPRLQSPISGRQQVRFSPAEWRALAGFRASSLVCWLGRRSTRRRTLCVTLPPFRPTVGTKPYPGDVPEIASVVVSSPRSSGPRPSRSPSALK